MNENQLSFSEEDIRFGYRQTRRGLAVIATSTRGVAAVLLGSHAASLRRRLDEALPGAMLHEDDAGNADLLDTVGRLIDAPGSSADVTLDMRGSPLERAVWTALRDIPTGETRSYGVLARQLDIGATAQEVGAACAANRLAVLVPCHRILKADGSISGYRWGVDRKRRLLALESAA